MIPLGPNVRVTLKARLHNPLIEARTVLINTGIDRLCMPLLQNLKHVLREMDLDNTGMVDEKNFEDSLKILRHLRKGLDTDGSGHVTHQEMEDGVSLLTLLMEEKAKNSNEMPYKHLPEQIQELLDAACIGQIAG
eukprot:s721_g10.t4